VEKFVEGVERMDPQSAVPGRRIIRNLFKSINKEGAVISAHALLLLCGLEVLCLKSL
jgi:hypothetical protein